MKKITFLCFLAFLTYLNALSQTKKDSLQKTPLQLNLVDQNFKNDRGVVRCVTDENEERLQIINPERPTIEEFEAWLAPKVAEVKKRLSANDNQKMAGTVVSIPVVVHVIHNGDAVGTNENISYDRVVSQITVLNEDYRKLYGTPGYNTNTVGADIELEFCLAQTAPDGTETDGVDRVNLSGYTWNNSNVESVLKPTTSWDPTQYFNIWVCQFGGDLQGVLGYAQFPDGSGLSGLSTSNGDADTDGVVVDWRAFGSADYVTGTFYGDYNKGRTLTHEIGHCLGLRHIWGDNTSCVVNTTDSYQDYCPDTPAAGDANYYCITTDSCPSDSGNDMVENYMDYTPDECMNVFTEDQKARILAVLENSPRRMELLSSTVCNTPTPEDIDGKIDLGDIETQACSTDIIPSITLTNKGLLDITTATIEYYLDDNTPQTYTWSGTLAYLESETFAVPTLSTSGNGANTFNANIVSINYQTDIVTTNNSFSTTFTGTQLFTADETISLTLQPDLDGSQTTWELTNSNGATLYTGGPYANGQSSYNWFTGNYTYTLDTEITETFNLNEGCYTFTIYDSNNNGICSNSSSGANGYFTLAHNNDDFDTQCDYGSSYSVSFIIENTMGTDDFNINTITVYPNPAASTLNINTGDSSLPDSYTIYNTLGQTIMNKPITSTQDLAINTSALATGVYIIKIVKGGESTALQFTKK